MSKLNMFFRLSKIDEENRLVYGIATAELPDKSGEICDYDSSVPYYKAWSGEIEKASGGKSKGNVRAMHGNKVAGVLKQIVFNDDEKKIEICAKIIDDAEWNMCLEGGYTGFSQGGSYVKTWKDGQFTRYTANPSEVSIVDNPCLGEATFELKRADGSSEMRKLKSEEAEPVVVSVEPAAPEQVWKATDGSTYPTKAEALKKNVELASAVAVSPAVAALAALTNQVNALDKKDYNADDRKKMAESGEAKPDGSFPIKTAKDVENAVHDWGRAGSTDSDKEHIIARAKAIGATDELPADWEGSTKKDDSETKKARAAEFAKLTEVMKSSTWDAQDALTAMGIIECVLMNEEWEASMEGESEGTQIADLKDAIVRLRSFIASEISETDDATALAAAAKAVEAETLAKAALAETRADALQKQLDGIVPQIQELTARIAKYDAAPAMAKGKLFVVEKGHEVTPGGLPVEAKPKTSEYGERLTPAQRAAAIIRND